MRRIEAASAGAKIFNTMTSVSTEVAVPQEDLTNATITNKPQTTQPPPKK
jgi:hypothetical protein